MESNAKTWAPLTDSDGLDLDTLLGGRVRDVVGVLVLQNILAAEGVDEGCAA
jgi:hypothetical protein